MEKSAAGDTVYICARAQQRGVEGASPEVDTHSTSEGIKSTILLLEENLGTLVPLTSVPCYNSKPSYQQRHSAPYRQQKAGLWAEHL